MEIICIILAVILALVVISTMLGLAITAAPPIMGMVTVLVVSPIIALIVLPFT